MAQGDLLIGLKVFKVTGIDVRKFFRLHKEDNTWAQIIADLQHQEKVKKNPLLEAISSGITVEEAGGRIADEIIGEFYQVKLEEIEKLRMSGLNEKEMNLVFILVHARGQKPEVLAG